MGSKIPYKIALSMHFFLNTADEVLDDLALTIVCFTISYIYYNFLFYYLSWPLK